MKKNANLLEYYPRFIFNFGNGDCFSTGDLDLFKFFKEKDSDHRINQFFPGQKIDVYYNDNNKKAEVKSYIVEKIEIKQIKYDLDKPTYGLNPNDCPADGVEKQWLMEIYVFLNKINN